MTFTTPPGSYGARRPGRLFKMLSHLPSGRIRSRGRASGGDALVLTTVGAKSGQSRSNPVARFTEPDGSWLVVASAGGSASHPAWYHNLAAHPDEVVIEFDGERIPVSARELHGPERDEAWARVVASSPRFAGYLSKTDRVIPVIKLTRRG